MACQTRCLQLPIKALRLYPTCAPVVGDSKVLMPELSEIASDTSGVPTGYCNLTKMN